MKTRKLFVAALVLACLSVAVPAQQRFDFYARGPYRQQVPRPSSITGYEPGEFQSPHSTVVQVIERIAAAAPDRVRLVENGETWEHRKLYLAVVSAPENMARPDEIKANIARLADPRSLSEEEANRIAAQTPIVVWLNYGIHGNESASYEAVQQVLYQLAASEEPRTLEILKNAVVVLNVMHNPDGHERFSVWINSLAIGDPEPFSLEHREPYQIHGRTNHYRFDMNRDVLALSQAENWAVLRGVREWRPQVFVDHHGQVENYFFPPAAEPVNKNLPVERSKYWYDKFGRGNAAAFDRHGWTYYVRHVFDLFYAGYMDTWSSLQGATGMTYETDAGGPTSINLRLDDDTILPFRQGIAKHFTASMATLETAVDNREARLRDYYQFFKTGMEEVRNEKMKRVVLLPGRDPQRAAALVRNLVRQGIEVQVAREGFRSSSAHDYAGGQASSRDFPAGAYVIDLNQPMKRLAKAYLEPNHEISAEFIKAEMERRARNEARGKNEPKEGYEFYDITTWSLPLAMGVESYWTEDAPAIRGARVTFEEKVLSGADLRRYSSLDFTGLAASDGQALPGLGGGVEGGRANTAYIIPYGSDAASRLAIALLAEGYKVAVAGRAMNAGGRNWPAGTLLLRTQRNPETLHARIAELAQQTGARVYAVNSAYSEEGDTGVGSESMINLRAPRVAIVWDQGTSSNSYGWMWYSLERAYGLKFTPVALNALRSPQTLAKFNVVIFPDGSSGAYQSALGKPGLDALKAWVQNGGVLIGIGGAAAMFADKDVNFTSSRLVGSDGDTPPAAPASQPAAQQASQPASQQAAQPASQQAAQPAKPEAKKPTEPLPLAGTAFLANINRNHFLSHGYNGDKLVVLVEGDAFFRPSKEGANVLTFPTDGEFVVSGFTWPDNTETLLRGTAYVIDEPTGGGHTILFAGDPNFRFLWRTTTQMFLNAILLGPAY